MAKERTLQLPQHLRAQLQLLNPPTRAVGRQDHPHRRADKPSALVATKLRDVARHSPMHAVPWCLVFGHLFLLLNQPIEPRLDVGGFAHFAAHARGQK
jgi:hypothetical protein